MVQLAPRTPGFVEIAVGSVNGVSGAFKVEELGMGDVVTEVVELPEELQSAAPSVPSHVIAVKKAGEGAGYGLLFGGEFLIDNLTILAHYRPQTEMLECFHCPECAVIVLNWFKSKQREWEQVFSSRVDESTGSGPKRTVH